MNALILTHEILFNTVTYNIRQMIHKQYQMHVTDTLSEVTLHLICAHDLCLAKVKFFYMNMVVTVHSYPGV